LEPNLHPVVLRHAQDAPERNQNDDDESDQSPVVIEGDLSQVDWKSLVGKSLTIEGDLVVVDTYDLLRRGQVKVARERLYIPTTRIDPNDSDPDENSFQGGGNVAKVIEAQKFNDAATVIIDDGSARQNIFPPTLFPGLGTRIDSVRVGSVINGVSGKLVKAGRVLLLVPDEPLQWTPASRPKRPDLGDAVVTVASFNVLNYFTTIDDGRNQARGADNDLEFKRQEAKIVAAIIALEADVIGLMELENNVEAEQQLVAALNQNVGSNVFKACGIPERFESLPGGSDAIRVGIIYRSDRVRPVGPVVAIDDEVFGRARAPVVQTFASKKVSKPFTVIVNHFKSKGGASNAGVENKNKGDGQAAYNAARRSQAMAICNYIDQQKRRVNSARVLVIGDLNAYTQEDPIDAMRAYGLIDLRDQPVHDDGSNEAGGHYSYLHYGQSGSLDHALATPSLAADVTGVATWHINADEPRLMDYNQEYKPQSVFKPDPFRSSDHDPILIGIGN
jgi:predicted extracellular nuclease